MGLRNYISEEYLNRSRSWEVKSKTGEIRDEENPAFIFSLTKTSLLEKIASGELDLQQLARIELLKRRSPKDKFYYTFKNGIRVRIRKLN